MEAGGACVWGRGAFNVHCEEKSLWEFLTKEYVQGLGKYLTERVRQLGGDKVLEVGAGMATYLTPIHVTSFHVTDDDGIMTPSCRLTSLDLVLNA